MKISFDVPDEYPWTVLACLTLCLETFVISVAVVVFSRINHFNGKFMKETFGSIFSESFPDIKDNRPTKLGFPDIGSGRHSEKLTYKSWVEFNNAVRTHLNLVEQIHFILIFFMVSGLILPKITMVLAWMSAIGRIVYVIGYIFKGANGRMLGAFFNIIPSYIITIIAVGVLVVAGVKNGFYFSNTVPAAALV